MKGLNCSKRDYSIGVLGGMGTYATIHLFQQYAAMFPAVKEWDRPRIIIDNRCTMPSRVRAYLYNENVDLLVTEMSESMQNLVNAGCNRIILDCNTSHLFLPQIYQKVPSLEEKVIHIINNCADFINQKSPGEVYVLGTEGTIASGIYQNALNERGISCAAPSQNEYHKLRECIEAVKQNRYTDEIKEIFLNLVNRYNHCILGCTELPILYDRYRSDIYTDIYDPLYIALSRIHDEYASLPDED